MTKERAHPPELLSAILDSTDDIVIMKDLDGRFVYFNAAAERHTGFAADAVIGHDERLFFSARDADEILAAEREILASGEIRRFEERLAMPDGQVRHFVTRKGPVRDAEGKLIGIFGIIRDITAQRLVEQETRLDRERLAIATEATNQGIWAWDTSSGAGYFSDTYYSMLGYTPGEFPPTLASFASLIHPEDREPYFATVEAEIATGRDSYRRELRLRARDGSWRWIRTHGRVVERSAHGRPLRLIGSHLDITDEKLREQAIASSKALLRAVIDHADAFVYACDSEHHFTLVNRALAERVGSAPAQLIGRTRHSFMEAPFADQHEANERRVLESGVAIQFEEQAPTPDGIRHYLTTKFPLRDETGRIVGVGGISTDVTERSAIEDSLRNSREMLQRFLDHLPGSAYLKDSSLRVMVANRGFSMLGLNPAWVIGRSNSELFPGEFAEKISADDRRVLDSGVTEVIVEEFGGGVYETTKFRIPQDRGEPLLGGITLDITLRHRLQQRVRTLLELNEVGGTLPEREFLTLGLERVEALTDSRIGFLHFVNDDQESIELVTWTAGALAGCTAGYDRHYPISAAGIWADSFREKRPVVFNDYAGHTARRGLPDGHTPLSRLISVPVIEEGMVRMMIGVGNKPADYTDFDITTVQLIGNDLWRIARRARVEADLAKRLAEVTQLKERLEQAHMQLLQSEKMSAIGQLAAGIAHELNNPIGFVHSNLGTLAQYVDKLLAVDAAYAGAESELGPAAAVLDPVHQLKHRCDYDYIMADLPKLIAESKEGVDRVRRIVLDLKDFSRVGETEWQSVDLHRGLDSTINIVWNELKYKAEVVRDYGELPPVNCLASQINQVFMNLLVNAAQAIQTRGRIVLRSGCAEDGRSVWIEVEDNGRGMSPETLKRLFEPFFTTKPVGKGTGLGLSISYAIVERHHGRIEVRSTLGEGSSFRVTLPVDPRLATAGG